MENPEKKSHLSTIGVPILVAVMVIGLIVVGFLIVKKTFFDKGKIIVQNPADVMTSEITPSVQEGENNNPGQDTGNAAPAAPQTESKPRYLSVDEAKKIALDHAGLTEGQVRFSTAKFDDDDSEGEEYEIEFYSGNTEYEYEIDARTGDIRDFSKEVDDD